MHFHQQIESHSMESLLKSILDEYSINYSYTQNLLKSHTKESTLSGLKMPNLSNFYIYLRYHPSETDFSEYIKLDLFAKTLKNLHPEHIELKELASHSIFSDMLVQKMNSSLARNLQPNLMLNPEEILQKQENK